MIAYGRIRPLRPVPILILLASLAAGCSTGTTTSGLGFVDASGNHTATFTANHPAFAVSDVAQCRDCHGDDLTGGIANASCFTAACHHGTVPGWASPGSHGASAKRAPGNSGFASCQICHASDFTGDGSGFSCLNNAACHGTGVQSPHPARPWLAATGSTHTNTDPANAPVCAACHFPGSANNPANHPATPAPPGTAPGCFNNTLCHGQAAAPHVIGDAWRDPSVGGASFHGLTAKQDLSFCQTCHGTPGTILFNGGVAPTSCASCHPEARAHPVRWYQAPQPFPGYVSSHRDSGNRNVACAICHDVTQGRTAPDGNAPSCFSASFKNAGCHSGGPGAPNHNVLPNNLDSSHLQATQITFDEDCANCHSDTGTSPKSTAPNCVSCHTGFASSNPLTTKDCSSCHGNPPTGTVYPNIARKHAKHNALAGVTGVCIACHNGLDPRTGAGAQGAHYAVAKSKTEPGDVSILSTYNAKNSTASFASLSCSNVSCHGGQTINWDTGSIIVDTDAGCAQCHTQGTTQYNSQNSGEHNKHRNFGCTECHNMSLATPGAQNHFSFLSTPAMEGPARDTFQNSTGSVVYTPSTSTPGSGNCSGSCHNKNHNSETW